MKNGLVICKLEETYYDHLKATILESIGESTYEGCVRYYKLEVLPLLLEDKTVRSLEFRWGFGHSIRFMAAEGYQHAWGVENDMRVHSAASEYVGKMAEGLSREDTLQVVNNHPRSFEIIIALEVIEHHSVDDAAEMARLICRALAPGAIGSFLASNMDTLFGTYSRYVDRTHQIGFSEYSLAQLFYQSGFNEINLHLPQWDRFNLLTCKPRMSALFHR